MKYSCEFCGHASELQAPNDWCEECNHLVDTAVGAIKIARRVGVPRYGPSSWKEIHTQEHIFHAVNHLHSETNDEDHLAHAICRLVMARAIVNENTF